MRNTGSSGNSGRRGSGGVLGGGGSGVTARQVEQRSGAQLLANDTEAGRGRGILKSVPPDVGLAETRASNLVPVGLRVGGVSNSLVLGRTADGPAGLSDPDLLARGTVLDLGNGIVEQTVGVVDGVGLGVLEVGVGVNTNPVGSLRDSDVGGVGPGGPGVDVADLSAAQSSASNGLADLLDVGHNGVGVGTNASLGLNASGGVTVEILTAHGDTDNQLGEGVSVGVDGVLERSDLVVKDILASGGPETEQQAGVLLDGSGDGGGHIAGGTALDSGVQSGTGEARRTDEVLRSFKLLLEIGLLPVGAIGVGGTVVEALVGSVGGSERQREREKL